MTRSVLANINWAPPQQFVNPVAEAMKGAQFAQEMKMRQLQMERAQERTAEELSAVDRGREYMATRAALGTATQMEKAASSPVAYKMLVANNRARLERDFGAHGAQLAKALPEDPAQLGAYNQALQGRLTALTAKPQAPSAFNDDQVWAANRMAQMTGNAGMQNPLIASKANPEQFETLRREYAAEQIRLRKAGAASNTVNVTTGTKGKQEQAYIEADKALSMVDTIRQMGKEAGGFQNLVGWGPNITLAGLDTWSQVKAVFGDKLKPEDEQRHAQLTNLRATLDAYSAEITNEALGATQSEAEWDRAKRGLINANVSGPQFEAQLNNLERVMTRQKRIAQEILDEGVLRKKTKEYGKEFDRRNAAAREQEAATRAAQLQAEVQAGRMTDQQVAAKLKEEGLL